MLLVLLTCEHTPRNSTSIVPKHTTYSIMARSDEMDKITWTQRLACTSKAVSSSLSTELHTETQPREDASLNAMQAPSLTPVPSTLNQISTKKSSRKLPRKESKSILTILDLPPELRLMVYEFHLVNHGKAINLFLADCTDQEAMEKFGSSGVGVNLLCTCKQIHRETRDMFYDMFYKLPTVFWTRSTLYSIKQFENIHQDWRHRTLAFQTCCSKVKILRFNLDYFDTRDLGEWAGFEKHSCQNSLLTFPRLEKVEFLVYGKKGNRFLIFPRGNDLRVLQHNMRSFIRLLPGTIRVQILDQIPMSDRVVLPKAQLERLLQLDTLGISATH